MEHECSHCELVSTHTKQCAGCRRARYCSPQCQKAAWSHHKLYCKPFEKLSTAERLAIAVYGDLVPDDEPTRLDYGFSKALTPGNESKLLGLYIGLIKVMNVEPKTLHRWRLEGSLVREIKAAFEAIPEQYRGGYYPWFLEHQYVLDSSLAPPSTMEDVMSEAKLRAWRFIGGATTDTSEDIKTTVASWSRHRQLCHVLYTMLLSSWHPSPDTDHWIFFGFCTCRNEFEEMGLARLYQALIDKCSFDEFCTAFENSALLRLINLKGVETSSPLMLTPDDGGDLASVLRTSPHMTLSVWYLKQLIYAEDKNTEPTRAVVVDYGFMNCKNLQERIDLKGVYKKFFEAQDAKPLGLHEAAIAGKLFAHVATLVKIKNKDKKKFQRLMKNLYPLPDV